MGTPVPASSQKRLLRLVSARTDMQYASDAFRRFMATRQDEAKYHPFVSMVLAYCRPFTENLGIGSLRCEYPSYPDFPDADMNLRHQRMLDLRNKFLGHSSLEGTKVWLMAPGAINPATSEVMTEYGHAVAKRHFLDSRYAPWLHEVVDALTHRLDADVRLVAKEIGSRYLSDGEIRELDTGTRPFEWTK